MRLIDGVVQAPAASIVEKTVGRLVGLEQRLDSCPQSSVVAARLVQICRSFVGVGLSMASAKMASSFMGRSLMVQLVIEHVRDCASSE